MFLKEVSLDQKQKVKYIYNLKQPFLKKNIF